MSASVLSLNPVLAKENQALPVGIALLEPKYDAKGLLQDLLFVAGNERVVSYLALPQHGPGQSLAAMQVSFWPDLKQAAQKTLQTDEVRGFTWHNPQTRRTYLIQTSSEEPQQLLGVVSDVTEVWQKLQDKLYWSELLLRSVVDNLPSAVYAKDSKGRKILANQIDCRNAGVKSEAELLGKTDFDLFPRHIAEQFYQDDRKVLEEGQAILDREEILTDDTGKEGWLKTSKIPLKDAQGKIIGLVGFGHDITTEKRLAQENILVQNKIREQQRMVEEMILDLAAIPEKMGELVNGIASVAKQTKMVSINAAIESARVGELGRGFQIVADEVGRLSDQSSHSTNQVREAISEVDSLIQNILKLWAEVKLDRE